MAAKDAREIILDTGVDLWTAWHDRTPRPWDGTGTVVGWTGKEIRQSASSFKTFGACRRKWWFGKVAGLREADRQHHTIGKETHAVLEDYVSTGVWPPPGHGAEAIRVATPGIPHLQGTEGWAVERRVEDTCGPLNFLGFVDLSHVDPHHVQVDDHKTAKSFGWTKSSAELARDPQLVVYCYQLGKDLEDPAAARYTIRHRYYKTQGRAQYVSTAAEITWEVALTVWRAMEISAKSMFALATVQEADRVPPNPGHCGAFGGCPFQGICNASPLATAKRGKRRLAAPTQETIMGQAQSVKDKILARKAAKNTPAKTPRGRRNRTADTINPPDSPPTEVQTRSQVQDAAMAIQTAMDVTGLGEIPLQSRTRIATRYGLDEKSMAEALAIAGINPPTNQKDTMTTPEEPAMLTEDQIAEIEDAIETSEHGEALGILFDHFLDAEDPLSVRLGDRDARKLASVKKRAEWKAIVTAGLEAGAFQLDPGGALVLRYKADTLEEEPEETPAPQGTIPTDATAVDVSSVKDAQHAKAIQALLEATASGPISENNAKKIAQEAGGWRRFHASRLGKILADWPTLSLVDGNVVQGGATSTAGGGSEAPEVAEAPEAKETRKPRHSAKAPTGEISKAPEVSAPSPSQEGLVLCIGCTPGRDHPFQTLDEVIAPIVTKIEEEKELDTIWSLPFNDASKAIAGQLVVRMKTSPLSGVLVVDPRHPAAGMLLPILHRVPGVVVFRGTV